MRTKTDSAYDMTVNEYTNVAVLCLFIYFSVTCYLSLVRLNVVVRLRVLFCFVFDSVCCLCGLLSLFLFGVFLFV